MKTEIEKGVDGGEVDGVVLMLRRRNCREPPLGRNAEINTTCQRLLDLGRLLHKTIRSENSR